MKMKIYMAVANVIKYIPHKTNIKIMTKEMLESRGMKLPYPWLQKEEISNVTN
jgi:hypothetical protein